MSATRKSNVEILIDEKSDKKPLIELLDATDLPSALALLNAIKATLNQMNAPVA